MITKSNVLIADVIGGSTVATSYDSSEVPYLKAKKEEDAIMQPLQTLLRQLIMEYFDGFAARTKKAAHSEM